MDVSELAAALNEAASDYEIGRLQSIRSQLHGLGRVSRKLFSDKSIFENYAFQIGARSWSELQFNFGVEFVGGEQVMRHGVAFSLQLSQTVPTIDPFREKIIRFNDYVRTNAEDFPGLFMWHFRQRRGTRERSPDRPITPIDDSLVEEDAFIVLGRWVPLGTESVQDILEDFDRLMPLWCFVESVPNLGRSGSQSSFKPGCPRYLSQTTAKINEKTVDVALRHKDIQMALYDALSQEYGRDNIQMEYPLEIGGFVDGVIRNGDRLEFYELKIAPTVQSCVRTALGQLLEYSYWPNSMRASELVIVGEAEPDDESRHYLQTLRNRFSLPIWYRRMDMETKKLEPKE